MKTFAVVLFAIAVSAGAANARAVAHPHKMMAACADGAAKASCVCKATQGAGKTVCKAGEWCHSWSGTCGK